MADATREARERAEAMLGRDLLDPLWPGLTEGDWEQDAKTLARDVLALLAELDAARVKLRERAATAMALCDKLSGSQARVAVLEDALQEITKPLCQLGGRDRVQIANVALASAASPAAAQDAAPVCASVLSSEASGVGNEPGTGAAASPKGDT